MQQSTEPLAGSVGFAATGATHACAAMRIEEGRVWCWGHGALGATGYGSTENVGDVQTADVFGDVDVPPPQTLGCGEELSCALTVDEEVYCWGAAAGPHGIDGAHGHPGLGNIGDDETPMDAGPVTVW